MDYSVMGHYGPAVEATDHASGEEERDLLCECVVCVSRSISWHQLFLRYSKNSTVIEQLFVVAYSAKLTGEEGNYVVPGDEYVPATEQFGEDFAGAEFHETRTLLADGGDRFGVSTATFDTVEELMWMGNQGGHVTSYYGSSLQKYTSFQVHATQEIRHIHPMDEGILVLSQSQLRFQLRRGIPIFTHTSVNMQDMQCMLQISPTRLLLGGHQDKIIDFNLTRGKESGLVDVGEHGCAILRQHSRLICAGNPMGRIDLRDPTTLSVEHTLDTHSASLSDFDVQGNYLVTCGFSNSHQGLTVDRFLMVYDLRQMRALNPVTIMVYPLLLKFLPSYSSRLAVVSPLGQMQLLDTIYANVQPSMTCLYQVATGVAGILSFDVASTSQCLCFGDSAGFIHLMSTNNPEPQFNTLSRPTEFADLVPTVQSIPFDDDVTPLSTIPMIYSDQPLLSDWPEEFLKKVYRKTPLIDPEILRTMKMQGTIGYAPNPQAFRRNQIPYNLEKRRGLVTKLFAGDTRSKTDDGTFVAIPKRYRKIELKYSRLGYDDFDFDQYNRTSFCGLEATLPNSYCNAMLQLLYYCEPVRIALLSHSCQREFCLSCELGFLFHMLDTSRGLPCQAANFLRAFRTVPEASALGLILNDLHPEAKKKISLIRLIQSWNRFILHQIHYEILETRKRQQEEEEARLRSGCRYPPFVYNEQDFPSILEDLGSRYRHHEEERKKKRKQEEDDKNTKKSAEESEVRDDETEISRLFGSEQMHIHRCLKCGQEATKHSIMLLCNLVYPEIVNPSEEVPFTSVLARSLRPEKITPAWCDNCQKFTPTLQSRQLTKLPQILALNCGLDTQQDKAFWQNQMDIVVQNVLTGKESSPNSSPVPVTAKPCRYGNNCTRVGCRFRHLGRELETEKLLTSSSVPSTSSSVPVTSPPSHLYYSHSWIPHNIEISLRENGEISVKKINEFKNDSNSDSTQTNVMQNGQADNKVQIIPETIENDLAKEIENCNIVSNNEDGETKSTNPEIAKKQTIQYGLSAVVCYVDDKNNEDRRNIVALLRVGPSYHERSGHAVSQWYIFNDFCISPVTPQEAVWFNLDWKVPCVLHYTSIPAPKPATFISPLTYDVFGEDKCIARNGGTIGITFTPLSSDEMPKKGELVGIDAEFVTLNQEEAELRSDGKMSTIKPSHMSVARITCIRGQGPLEGTPFIDDYISTQEQVVDYLTKFSGIQPGDLDATLSSKHLTTLKSTYQKLRFLVDNGIIFVGHGLRNDFRVINLVVPPEQIVDTVLLFHLPHHRMVSLRFLTWHFLGKTIQSETHDSTEDARAALELYRKYKELENSGTLTETLKELYEVGTQLQWKVPDS
ncbi:PAB-dependent poly(A)-specific ribonuclease subunit PAN2 isoform X2 [Pseudomyrmex gracilis]|uniref:PAB-dependent poly(A)-specific ribonuclease subunit PAN2 isoform X2 n=1 Tax=Pseudomyrmex gracilis TaxID=219809 RepID=UPI000994A6FA|nr:PAB-dependent poly(A)-specific ribonuclease subunit PAN2 isoform X2 [Pseudomyrmex gracilis]